MSTAAQRLAEIEARIQSACEAAGRDRSEVRLLGASKTHPVPSLERADCIRRRASSTSTSV